MLALVVAARRAGHLQGAWRGVYAGGMVASLYFLVFVAVAQTFQKVPQLNAVLPHSPADCNFAATQGVVLALFVVVGVLAVRRFHPAPAIAALPA